MVFWDVSRRSRMAIIWLTGTFVSDQGSAGIGTTRFVVVEDAAASAYERFWLPTFGVTGTGTIERIRLTAVVFGAFLFNLD